MKIDYPAGFGDFMAEYIPGHSVFEIADEIKKRFPGFEFTPAQVRSYKGNHGIKSGTKSRGAEYHKAGPSKLFTPSIRVFIAENNAGLYADELADLVNRHFGTAYTEKQIATYRKNHKLKSGMKSYALDKGREIRHARIDADPLARDFKRHGVPHNAHPIGTIVRKADGLYIKVQNGHGPKNWESLARNKYRQNFGGIPDGCVVMFRDGDRENFAPENMVAVPRSLCGIMAQQLNFINVTSPEVFEAKLLMAKIKQQRGKIKRENQK